MSFTFSIETPEYRALPIPFKDENGKIPKCGNCYVRVTDLPKKLKDWLKVNPRIPSLNTKERLKGPVAKGIIETLTSDPHMMALKNNGITVLVEKALFTRDGGVPRLTMTLSDKSLHGIANGGHTLNAIFEAIETDGTENVKEAFVKLHIYEGLNNEIIPEIAEGLNRSLQVDNASLENLQGTFDEIKNQMHGKAGENEVAYRQGDPGSVDIHVILTMMAMLDKTAYSDHKKFPHTLFRQPKAVLQRFAEQVEKAEDPANGNVPYKIILPKLHEILAFSDRVQKAMAPHMARYVSKTSATKKGVRSGNEKNKKIPAYFDGGHIGGHIHLGWLYPVFSAFRANIDFEAWKNGTFKWIQDPDKLLESTVEELCHVIQTVHGENNRMPAEVGKQESSYRGCYQVVLLEMMTS